MADFGDVCRHRVLRPRHYGLTAAACGYFRTSPADLDWARASLLAGIVQAPSADDPFQDPAAAAARQRYMLARLTAAGTLTTARAAAISGSPLGLRPAGTAARCR